jgi:hypothetical protein
MDDLEKLWIKLYILWDEAYLNRLKVVHRRLYKFDRFIESLSWFIILGLSVFALMVIPVFLFMLLLGAT